MHRKILDDSKSVESTFSHTPSKKPIHLFTFFRSAIFKNSLKLGLTIFFVVLVNRSLKKSDFKLILGQINLCLISVSLLFSGLSFYFQMERWREILKSQSLPSGIKIAAKSMFVGFFLAFLTPGGIGELFKGVGIFENRKTASVLAVMIDRFFVIFLTVVFGVVFAAIQFISYKQTVAGYFLIMLLLSIVLCCFAGFFLNQIVGKIPDYNFLKPIVNIIRMFTFNLHSLPLLRVIIFTALSHICLIIQTAVLFEMFGSTGFLKNCVIAGLSYAFMLFVPFLIANIGIREFSFSLFLKKLEMVSAIKPEAAVIAFGVSSLILISNVILPAFFGYLWMLKRPPQR